MMNLLPNIQIGKRYRLIIRPTPEYRKPCCDTDIGAAWLKNRPEINGHIVLVYRTAVGARVTCEACNYEGRLGEGMWGIEIIGGVHDGRHAAIPYTFLEPIEGEDYDESNA